MTTIKVPDDTTDPDEWTTIRVERVDKRSPPILLNINDGATAGAWLSPAKAREVIAALQAAVDEVEPPALPRDEDMRPQRLVRSTRPDHSRDREIAARLKAKGGILFDVWYILHDHAYQLDQIADLFVEAERPSGEAIMDTLSQLQIMGLVEQRGDVPWTWQRPRAVVRETAPREDMATVAIVRAAEALVDAANAGRDLYKSFQPLADAVEAKRAVLPPRER